MIRSDRPEWVPVFTGLSVGQFQELVRIVAGRGGEQTGAGRRWGLSLADRVLLTTVYYRTNLTFRQIALLFGISKSAANRVVEQVAPLLVLPDGDLADAVALAEVRPRLGPRLGMGDEWQPTPERPAVAVFVDEYPRLSKRAKELAVALLDIGRKPRVTLHLASTQATSDALGAAIASTTGLKDPALVPVRGHQTHARPRTHG